MFRDDVIERLRAAQRDMRAGVARSLFLFGSVARDEAGPESDIDLFVDPDPARRFGFDEFMSLYEILQETLGDRVSYTTREGLHGPLRGEIERTAIQVF